MVLAPHLHVLDLKTENFSRDPAIVQGMPDDPLIAGEVQPTRTVAQLVLADERSKREFPLITLPVLTDRTFDYLAPSVRLARAYLTESGRPAGARRSSARSSSITSSRHRRRTRAGWLNRSGRPIGLTSREAR